MIYPRMLTSAAIQGMKHAIAAIKKSMQTGEVVDRPDLLVSFEELNELVGIKELERLEQRYLLPDHYERKYAGASEH